MDDLTVTTSSVPGSRWILQALERLNTWAWMCFKPVKSRSQERSVWKADPFHIRFLIQSVYEFLPSPSKLFCWDKVETPACPLGQGRDYWSTLSAAVLKC